MELKKIIKNIKEAEIYGDTSVDINNVTADSTLVTPGSLFICINGKVNDGHTFIKNAEKYGAVAFITEVKLDTSLPQIVVQNSRQAMALIASEYYNHPERKMKMLAVIGTNGKTTTSHLIHKILSTCGIKSGIIGTLGTFYDEKVIEPTLTTPDPLDLYKILADMYKSGVKVVVMEVSAHAIFYDKVKFIDYEVAVFTNFSRDHLDFFTDIDCYKDSKLKFFRQNKCKYVVTNIDDEVGREITTIRKDAITYGIDNPSDIFAVNIKEDAEGSKFVLNLFDCIYDINFDLIGRFNVYNALASATASALVGAETDGVCLGLNEMERVSGRLENVFSGGFNVFVDYAHTPDGLKKALLALRPICKSRLICVFGCGGNRDVGKRYEMGSISGNLADFTVITSDNPRYEDPMDIIQRIEKGMLSVSKNYVIVQDRAMAIEYALNYACEGDVVLIAGKGSEKYQEILGIKKLYNDKDTVMECLGRKKC